MKENAHLIISNVIVRAHSLNLHWTQHPANVVNDLDISSRGLMRWSVLKIKEMVEGSRYLLQLQQFSGLHQVLQLKGSFWHVV